MCHVYDNGGINNSKKQAPGQISLSAHPCIQINVRGKEKGEALFVAWPMDWIYQFFWSKGEMNMIENSEGSEEHKDYIERWHRRVQPKITKERRETWVNLQVRKGENRKMFVHREWSSQSSGSRNSRCFHSAWSCSCGSCLVGAFLWLPYFFLEVKHHYFFLPWVIYNLTLHGWQG